MSLLVSAVRAVASPDRIVRAILKRFELGSFQTRLAFDAFPRPWLAFGLWHAARLASRLGLREISAFEFGVANGNGLVELERMAAAVEREFPVKIQTYGFDLGTGLPAHHDYRDLPYFWRAGHYRMDEAAVRAKLTRSRLVLGPVAETVPRFLEESGIAPVGFIAFDVDYYTSTRDALRIFDGVDAQYLPRVFCYFDDVVGVDEIYHSEHTGELLAIREFNAAHERMKLAKIHGLAQKRPFQCQWAEAIQVLHRFAHPQYDRYLGD